MSRVAAQAGDLLWNAVEPIRGLLDALPNNATTAVGGYLALTSAVLLALVCAMTGPEMRVFPPAPRLIRVIGAVTALTWAGRGFTLLHSLSGPDARHAHWDMTVGWAMSVMFFAAVFLYVFERRMPADFWDRFAARDHLKIERARSLNDGTPAGQALAIMAASGDVVAGPGEGAGAVKATDLNVARIAKAVRQPA